MSNITSSLFDFHLQAQTQTTIVINREKMTVAAIIAAPIAAIIGIIAPGVNLSLMDR